MPTYITLLRYTQKGVENIKESPKRLDAAKQAFRLLGAEIKAFYLVTGQYDAVVISEAPDEETLVHRPQQSTNPPRGECANPFMST